MKKAFKFYFIAWAIMFVLFNIAVVALPKEFTVLGVTYEKFGGLSWVTLIVLELCFLLHLILTAAALNQKKLSGTFYRLPLIRFSYGCVVVTLILGVVAMLAFIPSWIPLALALLILAIYAMAVLKAAAAAELVEGVDEKVRAQTDFMRTFTVDAQSLLTRAKTPEARALCQKVYEAARYSDPMSSEALQTQEWAIRDAFTLFAQAVQANDDQAATLADDLLARIADRNTRCKALK